MANPTIDLMRALDFAARKHAGQTRKGAVAEPYINHLAEVAALLARASDGADPVLVLGGLLHDTPEDTETTHAELEEVFGDEVAALIAEVSDDMSLPKSERKRRQVEHAADLSTRAKLLKLADKTSNVASLANDPPTNWDSARRLEYVHWAQEVIAHCRGVNQRLEAGFDDACAAALASMRKQGASMRKQGE